MSIRKLLSIITLSCFILSSVCNDALPAAVVTISAPQRLSPCLEDLLIPQRYGRITDNKLFGSRQLVINIQDLHCHPEVQRNIANILSELDKRYGLSNVYVEGGYGNVDTSWICDIKDKGAKKEILEKLVDRGRLTGSEYYSALSDKPHLLRGIEDRALHEKNIVRLGRILDRKSFYEKKLKVFDKDLKFLKAAYFHSKNRSLISVIEKYRAGNISTAKYYTLLNRYLKEINENPEQYNGLLNVGSENYPNISAYLELHHLQKGLKYWKVSRQLQECLQLLKARMPYSAYVSLLKRTDNFSKTDELFICLSELAKKYGVNIENSFPELNKFYEYTAKSRALNPVELIQEEKRLVEELRMGFSLDISELEVSFLSDFYACFKDYLFNELTADDYKYFVTRFGKFKSIWGKYADTDGMGELTDDFDLLNEFYEANCRRNSCFISNIPSLADASVARTDIPASTGQQTITEAVRNAQVIVVVTGGFHTEGLKEILRDEKISYLCITPNITQDTAESGVFYAELAKQQAGFFGAQALALALGSRDAEVISITKNEIVVKLDGKVLQLRRTGETGVELPQQWRKTITLGERTLNKADIESAISEALAINAKLLEFSDPRQSGELIYQLVKLFLGWGSKEGIFGGDGLIWEIASSRDVQKIINDKEKIATNEIGLLPENFQKVVKIHAQSNDRIEKHIALHPGTLLSAVLAVSGMTQWANTLIGSLTVPAKTEEQEELEETMQKGASPSAPVSRKILTPSGQFGEEYYVDRILQIVYGKLLVSDRELSYLAEKAVSFGTERPAVIRALTLLSFLKGYRVPKLFDNYHVNGQKVRFKNTGGIVYDYSDQNEMKGSLFDAKNVMVIETHSDDAMLNAGNIITRLRRDGRKVTFVNSVPDEAGVSDDYLKKIGVLPETGVVDMVSLKKRVRDQEAQHGAELLGIGKDDFVALDIDLPVEQGFYGPDGNIYSKESIFKEPTQKDYERVAKLVKEHGDVEAYVLSFPFSNHPHHRAMTKLFLSAIRKYNRGARVYFFGDGGELGQYQLDANYYYFYDRGENERKKTDISKAYPSQDTRRATSYYADAAERYGKVNATAGREAVNRNSVASVKGDFQHAEWLMEVSLEDSDELFPEPQDADLGEVAAMSEAAFKQELQADRPSADIIVISAGNEPMAKFYQRHLETLRGEVIRRDVPIIVVPDPEGVRVGDGGALNVPLAVLRAQYRQVQEEYPVLADREFNDLRIFVMKAGGYGMRFIPGSSIGSKVLLPQPSVLPGGRQERLMDRVVRHSYQFTQLLKANNRPGIVVLNGDGRLETPPMIYDGVTLISNPDTLDATANDLGVIEYTPKTYQITDFIEKPTRDELLGLVSGEQGIDKSAVDTSKRQIVTNTAGILMTSSDKAKYDRFLELMLNLGDYILARHKKGEKIYEVTSDEHFLPNLQEITPYLVRKKILPQNIVGSIDIQDLKRLESGRSIEISVRRENGEIVKESFAYNDSGRAKFYRYLFYKIRDAFPGFYVAVPDGSQSYFRDYGQMKTYAKSLLDPGEEERVLAYMDRIGNILAPGLLVPPSSRIYSSVIENNVAIGARSIVYGSLVRSGSMIGQESVVFNVSGKIHTHEKTLLNMAPVKDAAGASKLALLYFGKDDNPKSELKDIKKNGAFMRSVVERLESQGIVSVSEDINFSKLAIWPVQDHGDINFDLVDWMGEHNRSPSEEYIAAFKAGDLVSYEYIANNIDYDAISEKDEYFASVGIKETSPDSAVLQPRDTGVNDLEEKELLNIEKEAVIPVNDTTSIMVVNQDELKKLIDAHNKDLQNVKGDYFDLYTLKIGRQNIVFITNSRKGAAESADRDSNWNRRRELFLYLETLPGVTSLQSEAIALELMVRATLVKIIPGASMKEQINPSYREVQLRESFAATQQNFTAAVRSYLEGAAYDYSRYENPDSGNYSHIRHFGWMYAEAIKRIRTHLKEHPDETLVVVDNGTGFGHFIVTAIEVLSEKELRQVRFIGTDINIANMQPAIRYAAALSTGHNNKVTWVEGEDISIPENGRNLNKWNAGFVVNHHVLEYLPGDTSRYIANWLEGIAPGGTLMVSVPFNEYTTASSKKDRTSSELQRPVFDGESFTRVGEMVQQRMPNIEVDNSLINGGMLVFRKKKESNNTRIADIFQMTELTKEQVEKKDAVLNEIKALTIIAGNDFATIDPVLKGLTDMKEKGIDAYVQTKDVVDAFERIFRQDTEGYHKNRVETAKRIPETIKDTVDLEHSPELTALIGRLRTAFEKDPERARVFKLLPYLHDIGKRVRKEEHPEIGAVYFVAPILHKLGIQDEKLIRMAELIIGKHVDISTIITTERTPGYLLSGMEGFSDDEQRLLLDMLIILSIADRSYGDRAPKIGKEFNNYLKWGLKSPKDLEAENSEWYLNRIAKFAGLPDNAAAKALLEKSLDKKEREYVEKYFGAYIAVFDYADQNFNYFKKQGDAEAFLKEVAVLSELASLQKITRVNLYNHGQKVKTDGGVERSIGEEKTARLFEIIRGLDIADTPANIRKKMESEGVIMEFYDKAPFLNIDVDLEWSEQRLTEAEKIIADNRSTADERINAIRFIKAQEEKGVSVRSDRYKDRIDLHIHTNYSDGRYNPSKIVYEAYKLGLKAIAITDHDTFDGVIEAMKAGEILGIEVFPGIEMSLYDNDLGPLEHFHMLAYFPKMSNLDSFIAWYNSPSVANLNRQLRDRRELMFGWFKGMIDIFNRSYETQGYSLHYDEDLIFPFEQTDLARALIDKYPRQLDVLSPEEIQGTYFPDAGLKRHNDPLPADTFIPLLSDLGGTLSIAHPSKKSMYRDNKEVDGLIRKYRRYIYGLEAYNKYNNRNSGNEQAELTELAQEHGLEVTIGSDYHAKGNDHIAMVTGYIKDNPEGNIPADRALHERIYRSFLAGIATKWSLTNLAGRAVLLLMGETSNKTTDALIDWHYLDPYGLSEAVKEFGAASIDENGKLHTNIYLAGAMPEHPEDWDLRNAGIMVNGSPVWVSTKAGAVVVFTETEDENAVAQVIEGTVTGKGKVAGSPRVIERMKDFFREVDVEPAFKNFSPGIVIDHAEKGKKIGYNRWGSMVVTADWFRDSNGNIDKTDMAAKLGDLMAVRNVESIATPQNIFIYMDVNNIEEFMANLEAFNKAGIKQMIVPPSVFNKMDDEHIKKVAELARGRSVKIYIDLSNASAAKQRYKDLEFPGYAMMKGREIQIVDYYSDEAGFGAELISGYGTAEQLQTALSNSPSVGKVLNLSDLRGLMKGGERSILGRVALTELLKTTILSLYSANMLSEKYVKDVAYAWDREKLPVLGDDSDDKAAEALADAVNRGDIDQILSLIGIKGTSHSVNIYLEKMQNELAGTEHAVKLPVLQKAFLTAIAEKMLAKKMLDLDRINKKTGLADQELEVLLGQKLLQQYLLRAKKAGVSVTPAVFAEQQEKTSKNATEFFSGLNSAVKKLGESNDPQAINTVIELIAQLGEAKFQKGQEQKQLLFDVHSMEKVLSAA